MFKYVKYAAIAASLTLALSAQADTIGTSYTMMDGDGVKTESFMIGADHDFDIDSNVFTPTIGFELQRVHGEVDVAEFHVEKDVNFGYLTLGTKVNLGHGFTGNLKAGIGNHGGAYLVKGKVQHDITRTAFGFGGIEYYDYGDYLTGGDTTAVEAGVGMRFSKNLSGTISGVEITDGIGDGMDTGVRVGVSFDF